VILLLAVLVAVAVAIGIWRGFTAIEWIWTFFAIAIGMIVLWLILVIFVVGPEMRRMAPFR
jgi:ABC-type spermidine/putrescine transport system permease subunit II